jgi:hypothetical protein
MIQEILTYKKIVNSIDDLMNKSPYKKNYIIEQIGIPGPTFYRKLKSLTFSPDEMLLIAKILNPEEFFMLELKSEIEEARMNYQEGKIYTHNDIVLELKNRRKKA